MNVLILYGTTEGHTRKIAEFLKAEAEKLNHTVTLCDSTNQPPRPGAFDAVIIGASVHIGKYQTAIAHYVKDNHADLNKTRSAFFSVSMTAASDNKESWKELEKITEHFLKHTEWKPVVAEQVAGALLFTQYDFFKRFIMRLISKNAGGPVNTSQDYEFTDWEKMKAFLNKALAATPGK